MKEIETLIAINRALNRLKGEYMSEAAKQIIMIAHRLAREAIDEAPDSEI